MPDKALLTRLAQPGGIIHYVPLGPLCPLCPPRAPLGAANFSGQEAVLVASNLAIYAQAWHRPPAVIHWTAKEIAIHDDPFTPRRGKFAASGRS